MSELSVFIDESGDFGSYEHHAPYYIITLVFHDQMVSRISREVSTFLREHLEFLQSFDRIIVYYDNGQKEITNLVNTLFNAFLEAEVRKVSLSDYSLFQAADMFCTLTLLEEKLESEGLSNSEKEFFMSVRDLKKNYLKPAHAKRLSL